MSQHASPYPQTPVWDLPLRVFHWGLVASVTLALVSGFLLGASWLTLHIVAGLAALGAVLFRLLWGFTGSTFSRFASFPPSLPAVLHHLKSLGRPGAAPEAGHNPLGALMAYALMALVLVLGLTGLVVLGGVLKQGPFKGVIGYLAASPLRELHEIAAWVMLAAIAAHLAGAAFESWREKINLPRAMITGSKPLPAQSLVNITLRQPRVGATLAGLLLMAGIITPLAGYGMIQKPLGVPGAPLAENYISACGDCHIPFHPSLLPAPTWQAIMAGLDDHFGEDATLPADQNKALSDYLAANAAGHWDTLPAHVLAVNTSAEPLRITTTRFWARRHSELPAALFTSPAVKAKSNCEACHKDARSGLFAPQAISIPKETTP